MSAVVLVQAKAGPRMLQDVAELQCLRGRQGWVMHDHQEGVLPLLDGSKCGVEKKNICHLGFSSPSMKLFSQEDLYK